MGRTNGGKRGELVAKITGHAAWPTNGKSAKTLMRMRIDVLQGLLASLDGRQSNRETAAKEAQNPVETVAEQSTVAPAYIPTDREIHFQAAQARAARTKPATKDDLRRWIALALSPWMLMRRVVGL